MNIDEFYIGQNITSNNMGQCKIIDKTKNSIEIQIKRKTEEGIDCTQWFSMKEINKYFKLT